MTPPRLNGAKRLMFLILMLGGLVLSEESEENILVNLHGLLGEPDAVQIEIASENLEEGSQFVYDNVSYQVTRTIMEDVEHPLVYVMVLDIFADS